MWGREARAGLIFVLVSVAAGGAFRGWQRTNHERFKEIVASLVEPEEEAGAPAAGTAPRSEDSAAHRPAHAPSEPGARARRSAGPPRPASIDVDRAGAEELLRLPGIGPSLAARIVAERDSAGPFGGPDGLLRVRGIGTKTLEKIRVYLTPAPEGPGRAK